MIVTLEQTLLLHRPPQPNPTSTGLSSCHERKKKNFLICVGLYTLGREPVVSQVWQLRTFQHKSVNFQPYHYRCWLDSKPKQTSKIFINTRMFVICVHPHIGHSRIGLPPIKFQMTHILNTKIWSFWVNSLKLNKIIKNSNPLYQQPHPKKELASELAVNTK